jgi:hypothetical protein
MENKMNRIIRACINLGSANPIHAIHDQGAGGNGNVLKEICEPIGARRNTRRSARRNARAVDARAVDARAADARAADARAADAQRASRACNAACAPRVSTRPAPR